MQGFRYFCRQKLMTSMGRKFAAVLCSTLLLSPGWLGGTGFTLLFGLVPLLWISDSYDASRRSWWKVFGWALLTFVLWNVSTIWWIWLATPVGPFAATIASSFLNMVAFMLFHTVSKKGTEGIGLHAARFRLDRHGVLVHDRRLLLALAAAGQRILARSVGRAMVRIHGHLRRYALGASLEYPALRGLAPSARRKSLDLGRSGRTPSDSRFAGHFLELRST